jgi:Ice-binding-like
MSTSPQVSRPVFSASNFSKFRSLCHPLRLVRTRRGLGAVGVGLLSGVMLISLTSSDAFAAATAPNLGSAMPYAVIAGSTITNTGSSVINGDIALSPGTSITGFPPGLVNGTTDAADANSLAAQTSSTGAYGVAAGETPFATVAGGTLGGNTYAPGIYNAGALALTGSVTLNAGGNAAAVFIFQSGSTLVTATSSSVVLEGGAQACNVFWTVDSSATLGTTTDFAGTILAQTSITMDTGASISGRLFAQTGAVTLDDNAISLSTCAATTPTTTTTTTTTSPTTTTTHPTTTTTHPAPVKKPVTTKPKSKGSGTTIIPVGAPATGEGGTAGSSFSPLGLIGLGAIALSATAASIAWRTRRRRN